jgi:hypothetical protein
MNGLPAEITSRIVSFLPTRKKIHGSHRPIDRKARLAPYATISRAWNVAIEAVLWRSLKVGDADWVDFVAGIGDENGRQRKRRLTSLNYTATWDAKEGGENQHDQLFSAKMVRLYDLLADWGNSRDIALRTFNLNILHPENEEYPKNQGNLAYLYLDRGLFGAKWSLPYILEFSLFADQARLWPGDVEALVAPFGRVETLCVVLHDWERKDRDIRRKARLGMYCSFDRLFSREID